MPIKSESSSWLGKITIIENKSGAFTISTAKEGLFKGLSTVVLIGKYPNSTPFAKIIYNSVVPSEIRRQSHKLIVDSIVRGMEEFNVDLKICVMSGVDTISNPAITFLIHEKLWQDNSQIIKEVQFQK